MNDVLSWGEDRQTFMVALLSDCCWTRCFSRIWVKFGIMTRCSPCVSSYKHCAVRLERQQRCCMWGRDILCDRVYCLRMQNRSMSVAHNMYFVCRLHLNRKTCLRSWIWNCRVIMKACSVGIWKRWRADITSASGLIALNNECESLYKVKNVPLTAMVLTDLTLCRQLNTSRSPHLS